MKKKVIPSVAPIYIAAAVWALCSLFIHPNTIGKLLLLAVLAAAGYVVGRLRFPGKTVEVEEAITTGDADIDKLLADSKDALAQLRAIGNALGEGTITAQIDRMDKAGQGILKAVAEKTERASQVRRFMQYYLPMANKLLSQYKTLHDAAVKGENIEKGMRSVENSLDLIAVAFEKQLDVLYKDEALDMTTDVSVLETLIRSDGLTDEGIKNILKEETQNG